MSGEEDLLMSRPASRGRKVAISLNAAAELLLAAALVLMINYLSFRHYARADWSRGGYYALSDKTFALLNSLTGTVDVAVFFQPQQDIYEDVDNLLKEYVYASDRIRVERVDPDRDLGRTEELMRKYKVEQANVVVFDYNGRSKYVGASEIVEYDYSPMTIGERPQKVAFKGEQAFSSAIQSVTQGRRPVVYFLEGHGERDIKDYGRSGGYSSIAREIERDNIDVRKLVLGEQPAIPDDADALVIAGPQKPISEPELSRVRAFLEQKGRLIVLLDAMAKVGLEPLLSEWGVRLAEDIVIDTTRTLTGRELFVTKYGAHPITAGLGSISSVFYLPRSVEAAAGPEEAGDAADKPRVVPLASSSEAGWAENDLAQDPMKYDPETDRAGPVPVAVAVERGPVPGIDVQIRPTRLVVFGDSDFVSNGAMTGGNSDLFLNSLNWVLEREELMGIAPKPVEQTRLVMSRVELSLLFWTVVCVMPGFLAVAGALVWLRRRA
jgi:ABC-type uncharacterized transport system involved in gliding motility auxiliary subunit